MTRRFLAWAVLAAVMPGAGVLLADEPSSVLKVVVHINFPDAGRQGQGLKNIENVLKEVGDTGAVVEVVCHSGGIGLVERKRSDHVEQVAALVKRGVRFVACRNTMRQKSIEPEDLIEGVGMVTSGALEVIRKQHEGYAYFRP